MGKINKFIFFTDIHLANTKPRSRIDDYNESIFKKLEYIASYARQHKIKDLVIGGDIAHKYKISDELTIRFVDMFSTGFNVYYIYGNHDVHGANYNHIDKTNFGFLERYPMFIPIDGKVVEFDRFYLSGINYVRDDCREVNNFPFVEGNKKKILVIHPMYVDKKKSTFVGTDVVERSVYEASSNADLVLCGHYHNGFRKEVIVETLGEKTVYVNPGSIARIEYQQASAGYGPRFVVVSVGNEINVKFLKIPCGDIDEIFDLDLRSYQKMKISSKQNFIKALRKLASQSRGLSVRETLLNADHSKIPVEGVDKHTIDKAIHYLELAEKDGK